ncbi:hypothetical protein OESDEN_06070 [Oesophagostomum dentatum]|uniref:Cytochrome b561 domain-containing protein n=1 Tax=Oesophagostomum dentatum TaxID=61180 RepID=A0A0B1TD05_OESDE|nr:hypothetical protein OESDEN_06070 [Oesophagostomum dentatum]
MVVYCANFNGSPVGGLAKNGPQGSNSNTIVSNVGLQSIVRSIASGNSVYCAINQRLDPNQSDLLNLNGTYYILLASGPTEGNSEQRDEGERTTRDKLMIAHGILMVLSWSIFLSTGILFARHFKGHFPDTTICGLKIWFHNNRWGSVHAMLGLVACVVAWAQPLNAVFRCHPEQRGRFLFNIIHGFFGTGSWLCAVSVAATMIAVVHFNSMFSNRDAALGLYIAFVAVAGLTILVMEALTFRSE